MKLLYLLLGTLLLAGGNELVGEKIVNIRGGGGIVLPAPPPTEVRPVAEDLHGTTTTDPYRWLEDGQSPDTRAWIERQMKYTQEYLSQVKLRPQIVKRLAELERLDSYTVPYERSGKFYFTKRLAEENQASIYVRKGLHGGDQRLVDANQLGADQNTSVSIDDVTKDGELLAYGVREGGADEEVVHFLSVKQGQPLPDVLPRARYGVSFAPDKKGAYYTKIEPSGPMLYYHRFGTDVHADPLVFGKKFRDETFGPVNWFGAQVTDNGRYLLVTVGHGVPATRIDIYSKDLREPDAPIREVIHGINHQFQAENYDDDLYVLTDYGADNYHVIKLNMKNLSEENWQTLVPESKEVISAISIVGGKLFVTGLQDVVTQTRIYSLDGKALGSLHYPTLGAGSAMTGRGSSNHGFYTFESFNIPPAIYHYHASTGTTEVFAKPKVPFSSDDYEVKQLFIPSKDGTKVPMFVCSKKGAKRDGNTPLLLYAYGGFNVSKTPEWQPEFAWWMEQGGYYALPNLRGGGEYGERWHKAGMFEKKQNVFDDLFAAAEYLIANQYTSTPLFALRGRSNGGLLMGAALTQRPDLFGAIWCGYPLLDMLRYQNFLVGRWWTTEYGSAEDPEQFRYLLKYSPYQNVKRGVKYPAVMFNTGDSDTRVDPLHARKMTALMEANSGSDRPILLRYNTAAGHGSGVSITEAVKETADELAFLWNETVGRN
jgi:prolyl oligopeptidase